MATTVGIQTSAFRRVVVPLDGSPAAEEILGHLQRMVETIDEILLLHVVPEMSLPVGADPTSHFKPISDAEHYLLKIQSNSIRTRTRLRVEHGGVAERISAVCREEEADLLAFTTHAKRGLGSVFFGGVARELVRTASIPILLARPGIPRTPKRLERILVPLGNEPAEQRLLKPIHRMALQLHAEVDLLRVNPIVLSQDPVTGIVLPLGTSSEPVTPLETIARTLPGIRTQILTEDGDVAAMILEEVRRTGADLLAMSTHGRSGIDRILSGSFAEDVLKRLEIPILLQHLPEAHG